ncbi:PREDICTED: uncharacterized protein LOC107100984 [Cyprinodon variegatus]|uniref:uncharacterized protein LOC107100984 n=1 Tax=Cyprinodon variegatus TaxID=28743 RepID=UPI000742B543|nr:PREDICTED: uncharacterized protein LOC107100984 [Cyprinodon variegatus]
MERLLFLIFLGPFYATQVQALPQAKLTVNSSRIKDTDKVTLSCQAPKHVSVHHCRFYVNGGTQRSFPCKNTLTGTELLFLSKQSSPSVVAVRCYYTVIYGALDSPSPHSNILHIIIDVKPQLAVNYYKGHYAIFTCSLAGSVKHDSTCNLYFGESSHPVKTKTVTKNSRTNQWSCQTEIPEDELLSYLHVVQQKEVSCDYVLENDETFLTARSDPYSFAGMTESTIGMTSALTTTKSAEPNIKQNVQVDEISDN